MAKYKIIYAYESEVESVDDIDETEAEKIRANGFGHYYWNDINAAVWSWDFMSEEDLQEIASGEVGNCLQTIDLVDESGAIIYHEEKTAKEIADEKLKEIAIAKDYRTYPVIDLGYSEIATLIAAGKRPYGETGSWVKTFAVCFPMEGEQKAYLVGECAVIPESFKLIGTVADWCNIYDDEKLVYTVRGCNISFYRDGMTCIIKMS